LSKKLPAQIVIVQKVKLEPCGRSLLTAVIAPAVVTGDFILNSSGALPPQLIFAEQKNVTVVNPLVERTAFNYVVGPLVMSFNQAFRRNDGKYPMLLPLHDTMGLLCSRTADARLTLSRGVA